MSYSVFVDRAIVPATLWRDVMNDLIKTETDFIVFQARLDDALKAAPPRPNAFDASEAGWAKKEAYAAYHRDHTKPLLDLAFTSYAELTGDREYKPHVNYVTSLINEIAPIGGVQNYGD